MRNISKRILRKNNALPVQPEIKKPSSDTDYIINHTFENIIKGRVNYIIKDKITKYKNIFSFQLNSNQYELLTREISKIKLLFRDSLCSNYEIGDSLFTIFIYLLNCSGNSQFLSLIQVNTSTSFITTL